MSTIDIRNDKVDDVVDCILFADPSEDNYAAFELIYRFGEVYIRDDEKTMVLIETKTNSENLIKALTKAIHLGWFD